MREKINKWLILILLAAVFVIYALSLLSFSPADFFLYTYPPQNPPANLIGKLGVWLAGFSFFLFGQASWLALSFLFIYLLRRANVVKQLGVSNNKLVIALSLLFIFSFFSASLALFSLPGQFSFKSGGLIGFLINDFCQKYLGKAGSAIFYFTIIILSSLIWGGEALVVIIKSLGKAVAKISLGILSWLKKAKNSFNKPPRKKEKSSYKVNIHTSSGPNVPLKMPQVKLRPERKIDSVKKEASKPEPKPSLQERPLSVAASSNYDIPLPHLLAKVSGSDSRKIKEDIKHNVRNLEDTLADFGINAKVVNVEAGPVVTMYELEPAAGVKINKISALADDIALAMKSAGVRIVAPLPGRGTVGVEIPNSQMSLVYLKEIIEDKAFQSHSSSLALALGKDVAGHPLVADLKDMPHLLIAGATGSGKTVCVNSIICSLLFKSKPEKVRLILVDPKMVELASFKDIPHLLSPIVSDVKKASNVLFWAVEEMEKRYRAFAQVGARNIDAYNKIQAAKGDFLPFIVIVIDELADLMVAAKDQIESAILRLAQLSRAAGIHLIMATQRPSVDVVTGVIKANFPARISFKVASRVDSRTVLDAIGAEKLLGKGDMLFIRPGLTKPIRAQGCFVSDEDISNLVNFVKSQGKPSYDEQIIKAQSKTASNLGKDDLFEDAVRVVLEAGQASASIIQRRLRVGYNRAARLLDLMEEAGIVGPFQGSKARKILVDSQTYLAQQGENNAS